MSYSFHRFYIILSFFILFLPNIFCQQNNDREKDLFSSNVKKVVEKAYWVKESFGENVETLYKITSIEYNPLGNRIEYTQEEAKSGRILVPNNISGKKISYEYDEKHRINRTTYFTYTMQNDLVKNNVIIYKYDTNDRIIDQSHYDAEGNLVQKIITIYNDKENIIEVYNYESSGPAKSKKIIKKYYDTDGSLLKEEHQIDNKKPLIMFDKAKKIDPQIVIGSTNIEHEYDINGIKKRTVIKSETGEIKTEILYDPFGNKYKQFTYQNIYRFGKNESIISELILWEYIYK